MAGEQQQQQFFLKWNDFQSNMVSSFRHLRDEKSFTDVTLACEGQTCKAHKMVLSACSPYFKSLLEVSIAVFSFIVFYVEILSYQLFQRYSGAQDLADIIIPTFTTTHFL